MGRQLSLVVGPYKGGPQSRSLAVSENMGLTDYVSGGLNLPPSLTHGSEVTPENTGYGAWFDTTLGRNLVLSDLATISGDHYQSDFYTSGTPTNPTVVYRKHFTGKPFINLNNIIYRGCLFDVPPTDLVGGAHHQGIFFDYCSVDTEVPYAYGIGDLGYSANRCFIRGSSDALRTNGGPTPQYITECYLRVKMADEADHNDSIQNLGGNGNVYIRRCNMDLNPEGGIIGDGSTGGPDGCILSTDLASSSRFHMEVVDCWMDGAGSAYTIRFYDGSLTKNISYVATGNRFVRNPQGDHYPIHRGTKNTTPLEQIVWANNVWDDDGTEIELL